MSTPADVVRHPATIDTPDGRRPVRVGVICDFREEQWPSMNLVGEMVCRHLRQDCSAEIVMAQLMPSLKRRFDRVPFLPGHIARNADRLANRFIDYPSWLRARAGDFDLFHLVDHSYSQLIHVLPAGRTVVTCHDLDTFRCLLEPHLEPRPPWFRAMTRWILDGFQRAAHVIAVSGATRDGLLRHRLFPPERISVVWNGVHPCYSQLPDPDSDARAGVLMPQSSPNEINLLSVGSTIPRKRLDILLRVFAAVRRKFPEARLVRVGGLTRLLRELAAELKIEEALVTLPYLEPGVLAAVYRRSTMLLHTAEAEGFGLPLIEAMACGCPVVASDIPILREVGGAAAVYCPLGDIDPWAGIITTLICERNEQRVAWEQRRQLQLARAAKFSWTENARQTTRIYKKVLPG